MPPATPASRWDAEMVASLTQPPIPGGSPAKPPPSRIARGLGGHAVVLITVLAFAAGLVAGTLVAPLSSGALGHAQRERDDALAQLARANLWLTDWEEWRKKDGDGRHSFLDGMLLGRIVQSLKIKSTIGNLSSSKTLTGTENKSDVILATLWGALTIEMENSVENLRQAGPLLYPTARYLIASMRLENQRDGDDSCLPQMMQTYFDRVFSPVTPTPAPPATQGKAPRR